MVCPAVFLLVCSITSQCLFPNSNFSLCPKNRYISILCLLAFMF